MIINLSHTVLFVHDQDKALEFYKDILGFTVLEDHDTGEFRWLAIAPTNENSGVLVLFKAMSPEQTALVGKQAIGLPFFALATDNCKAEYEKLKKQGVTFHGEPETQPWGTAVIMEDLYGNLIYLIETQK